MELLTLPIFAELKAAKRILIAGAGGGFDVFCGLPLYFGLRAAGKEVFLANLSFSVLTPEAGRWLTPDVVEVTADSPGMDAYFPERYLSRWFREQGEEVPIYTFGKCGVAPLMQAYETLVDELEIDTLLLVDGGTDSLHRGGLVGDPALPGGLLRDPGVAGSAGVDTSNGKAASRRRTPQGGQSAGGQAQQTPRIRHDLIQGRRAGRWPRTSPVPHCLSRWFRSNAADRDPAPNLPVLAGRDGPALYRTAGCP